MESDINLKYDIERYAVIINGSTATIVTIKNDLIFESSTYKHDKRLGVILVHLLHLSDSKYENPLVGKLMLVPQACTYYITLRTLEKELGGMTIEDFAQTFVGEHGEVNYLNGPKGKVKQRIKENQENK